MKSTIELAALVIGLIAALVAVCPQSLHAADRAVGLQRESVVPGAVTECPVAQPAASADCAAGSPVTLARTGAVTRGAEGAHQARPEPNDASGNLLEDLVKKGPGSGGKKL